MALIEGQNRIRMSFVQGVHKIFYTLFNDGVTEGIDFYHLSTQTQENLYGESKGKIYQKPIKLISKASVTPTHGEQDVESFKGIATFTVPLKDLQDKGFDLSTEGLQTLRQGIIEFQGTFYIIDNINPNAYVEDVFLLYTFECTEDLQMGEIVLEEDLEEGDSDGKEGDGELKTDNDW